MYLVDGELIIRSAIALDAKMLCRWWNDGSVMAHAGFPHGLGTTEERICEQLAEDNESHRRMILEYRGIPIGEMGYREVSEGVVDIGIKLCESVYQEKGLGTKYLSMLIQYLFEEKQYKKIILDTNVKNTRAQHVYEKLGFRKVRVCHESWKDQVGELQSVVEYELCYVSVV